MQTKEKIEKILSQTLSEATIKVRDDSALHKNHAEAMRFGGGHYNVQVVSRDFEGKTALERHKIIYEALKDELKTEVHALQIKALSPQEIKEKSA